MPNYGKYYIGAPPAVDQKRPPLTRGLARRKP